MVLPSESVAEKPTYDTPIGNTLPLGSPNVCVVGNPPSSGSIAEASAKFTTAPQTPGSESATTSTGQDSIGGSPIEQSPATPGDTRSIGVPPGSYDSKSKIPLTSNIL